MKAFFVLTAFLATLTAGEDHLTTILTPSEGVHPGDANKKIVEVFYDAMEKGDGSMLRGVLARNYSITDASLPYQTDFTRFEAFSKDINVRGHALHRAFPDLKIEVGVMVAEKNRVMAEVEMSGTQRGVFLGVTPTGKPVSMKGMVLFTIVDGHIEDIHEMWNTLSVMRQIGYIAL